ncbi:MAG: CHAT domain-containing protein [Chloroflexota bacterium]
MPIHYRDFDLLIERAGDSYNARVVASPAGEASAALKLPFSQSDVEQFFAQIGHSRLIESPQTQKMREFGQQLFEATFTGEVRDRLRESLNEVSRHDQGLRIRLRISNLPELANLPWEFMYDPSSQRGFLALSVETPLVRYLEIPREIQPLAIQPPLHILAMVSSPRDFPTLDTNREWDNLQEALGSLESRGMVSLTRLSKPTLLELQRQLRRGEYHIFHFVGHGVFSKRDQDGFLLFEDDLRGGQRVSSRDLGILLRDHRHLRLAVLNACEGARTSMEDQFSGTAQSLIQQGLPAVIAMQFRITDLAAITLAREFYTALADGYPVDAALTEARKAIKMQGNELEWGTPVLYMRSPDGAIFDLAAIPSLSRKPALPPILDDEQQAHVENLYTEALEAYYLGKWESAFQKFQAILDIYPRHADAAAKLEIARQKAQLLSLHERAVAAEKAGDWEQALAALEALAGQDANFEAASARLSKVRREKQLSDLYAEAQRLAGAGKWQAALNILAEIDAIAPRHPDPSGLRAQAEQQLAKTKRQTELETSYNAALKVIDNGDWREAVQLLRRVRGLQSGYRESESLLKRAESELGRIRTGQGKPQDEAVASKTNRQEWLFLLLFAGFGLSRGIAEAALGGSTYTWFSNRLGEYAPFVIYMLVFGTTLGLVFWWWLRMAGIGLTMKRAAWLVAGFPVCVTSLLTITLFTYHQIEDGDWIWTVMFAVLGLALGALIASVLRQTEAAFNRKVFIAITVGWGLAFFLGQYTGSHLYDHLEKFTDNIRLVEIIAWSAEIAIAGLIGGMFMFSQLETRQGYRLNWKTVLSAALGVGLGNALTNLIFISYAEAPFGQLFVWGLISGASLAVPSKDLKRYLLFGILGGVSLYLGYEVCVIYDIRLYLLMFSLFGLVLGATTKSLPRALIFSLFSIIAFAIRTELGAWIYRQLLALNLHLFTDADLTIVRSALSACVLGAILGAAWSFLNSGGSVPTAKQDAE